jgi:hypothetical protein
MPPASPPVGPGAISGDLRRARVATASIFFVTGAVTAAWATRIPAVQERLGLSPGELGVAILGLEGGAVFGLPAGGAVVARMGSPWALRLGFFLFPTSLVTVALAPGLATLVLALGAMAGANSIVDVAMNAQGVEIERRYGRPLLSSLHAGHPFGLVAGGLAGTAAAAARLPVIAHFTAAAVITVLAGVTATRWLLREPAENGHPAFIRPTSRLMLIGLIAFCAFLLDAAASNWSAVHMRTDRGAGPALAAATFTAFALALAFGRLAGDRLVGRFGRLHVVQGCGMVAAAGAGLVVAGPTAPLTLAGWVVLGLGLAALAPTALGAAADVAHAPQAIAAVTMIGYLGSFSGPPAIGAVAEATSLSAALGVLVLVGALTTLLAAPGLKQRGDTA